jgi:predicted TIM-barrel fold metal-dependent hydrolase
MSHQFIFSPAFAFMLMALPASPFDIKDEKIKKIILNAINNSVKVDYVVLLALDGVYKKNNSEKMYDKESHLVVPNSYIIDIAENNKKVLFGASVHPYRKDMEDEVARCIRKKAVLFKCIPSSQQIDLMDDQCVPFFKILAREGIPLLCHTGPEHAVPTSLKNKEAREYNHPKKLKNALDNNVKVIAAHCAASYLGDFLDPNYFEDMMSMLRKRNPNLYADISAFCFPLRIPYLEKILDEIQNGNVLEDHILFGSDFPIPILDINKFKSLDSLLNPFEYIERGNPLDNNYNILEKFGVPPSIFTNACKLLNIQK